jgi:hypothetical protein
MITMTCEEEEGEKDDREGRDWGKLDMCGSVSVGRGNREEGVTGFLKNGSLYFLIKIPNMTPPTDHIIQ